MPVSTVCKRRWQCLALWFGKKGDGDHEGDGDANHESDGDDDDDDSDDDGNDDVNMRIPSNENFPANQYRSDDA